jgi:FeS assembly SUF system regulator
MLKLGKLADYATLLMTVLAAEPARLYSAHELAGRTHVAEPTAGKLLKLLARGGLVESLRGAQGGYRLARAPDRITVADVINAVEGPIAVTQCSVHKGNCAIEAFCGVRANWRLINKAIRGALETLTVAQMAEPLRRTAGSHRFITVPLVQVAS